MSLAYIVTLHGDVLTMRHNFTLQALREKGEECARQQIAKAADTHHFETVRQVIFVAEIIAKTKQEKVSLESITFSGDDLNLTYWRVFRLQFAMISEKRLRQLNEVFKSFSRKSCEDWIKKCGLEAKELHVLRDEETSSKKEDEAS